MMNTPERWLTVRSCKYYSQKRIAAVGLWPVRIYSLMQIYEIFAEKNSERRPLAGARWRSQFFDANIYIKSHNRAYLFTFYFKCRNFVTKIV